MKVEFDIQERTKDMGIKGESSTDIYNLKEVQAIKNAIQEHFLFVGVDNRNNILDIKLVVIGHNNSIMIDTKDIIRMALVSASSKVILIHPSKNLKPSEHDLNISNKLNKMLKCFNITLADHIIVTENDYHSMAHNKEIDYDFNTKELLFIDNTFLEEENQKLKRN